MKVTVLIAVYNGGEYLRQAIGDVLGQTYADFELLVVDDASTDGSADLARSFDDPRIRVLRNPANLGQAPSLNVGLAEARGAYVARLDADDRMLPERLDRQVAVLDGQPHVALVGTWVDVVDESGKLWGTLRGDIRDYTDFVAAVLVDHYPFGHPSLMYRREVVLGLGGYDAELAPAEDKDLYRRLVLAGHEARVVREPLVHYRRHEGQLSQARRDLQLAVDHAGQERFLEAIVGFRDARRVRLLLETGVDRGRAESALLDRLLAGVEERLGVGGAEQERLARRLAGRLAGRALAAGLEGRRTLAWAGRRDRRLRALAPLLPLTPPARAAARLAKRVAAADAAAPLRRRARRSRLLRSIYGRLG